MACDSRFTANASTVFAVPIVVALILVARILQDPAAILESMLMKDQEITQLRRELEECKAEVNPRNGIFNPLAM